MSVDTLRLILGDQLSPDISSLADLDRDRDAVLMVECDDECRYVRHHKKKIAFVLSAMRHFAADCEADGIRVIYRRLDAPDNRGSLRAELFAWTEALDARRIVVTEPGEWRLGKDMASWSDALGRPVEIRADSRFFSSTGAFGQWASGRKSLRMEYFYRGLRRETGFLMDDDHPVGGQWNFDKDNRQPLDAEIRLPSPPAFSPDSVTREVLSLVNDRFADHFGDLEPFDFAVTREDAARARDVFLAERLPDFGRYQDAMTQRHDFVFHSVLSLYLNAGLLDARDLCRRAEAAYRAGKAPLNAVEGFIRQILGWREYVRGIYWHFMPEYARSNHLAADRPLPSFYWTGETEMACMRHSIAQTRRHAYAHHIQRLMVTGNFALLAGLDPVAVNEWYLIVYADAYEWVELPNTHGMALFADGGRMASKPYAASGKYIDRMSDYCTGCRFDVRRNDTEAACPFNYLYWDFIARNADRLRDNPRMKPIYRTLERMDEGRITTMRALASVFLGSLER